MTAASPTYVRFWKYVNTDGDCWLWTGQCDRDGYGRIKLSRSKTSVGAHRLSYEMFNGAIPDGAIICHTCDTPACVNPRHLYAGDAASNARDKVERGRWLNGYVGSMHCKHGHPFDEANTQYTKQGWRVCRACNRARQAASKARRENP